MSITKPPLRLRRLKKLSKQKDAKPQRAIRVGQNPIVLGLVGGLLLAAWLGVSLFQIQTTEAWALAGTPPGIANMNWGVLMQAGQLFTGNLSGAVGKAVVIGWVVELLTIVFGVCLEVAAHGVGRSSDLLKSIFVFGGFGLLAFNGWTDYNYGSLPSGMCGQVFFAALMSFLVIFGLPAGIELLIRAKAEFDR